MFRVSSSISIGTGLRARLIRGMTLVAQVTAENPTLSPVFILPRFIRTWIRARFAELPLLNIAEYFLPCQREKACSKLRTCLPRDSCFALFINLHSLSLVA